MPDKTQANRSVDGWSRTHTQEASLNDLAVATFGRGAGKEFLNYLKVITNAASGPEASDAALRHYAGQRHLIAIIDARIEAGRKQRREQ